MDLDPFGEGAADAGDGRDLLDRGFPDALGAPEDLQELALALGADARQLPQLVDQSLDERILGYEPAG